MSAIAERLTAALADRYRIERELGAGGMATVYLAQDLRHDRKVAIKVLKPELAAVLGAERFVVEIKTTAALQHPHILPLFDSGSTVGHPDASEASGGPVFLYYVMPFIDGETLRAKLDRETQLGVEEAVKIATDVADALQYAHEHGVIHRDIKPENILLANGRPMVADFGIALAVSAAAGGRMTETGLSLGTPHYMSPEQATAEKEITGRSDIYSLASVLYEMLTGDPPHTGASAQQIIMKIIAEPVAPVTMLRKSVPPHIADAIATALEKLPADRFASASQFAAALQGINSGNTAFAARRRAQVAPWFRDPRSRIALTAIGVLLVAAIVPSVRPRSQPSSAERPPIVSRLVFAGGDRIVSTPSDDRSNAARPSRTAFALSPDGRSLVYLGERAGVRQLFLRALNGETATPIAGTEDAESPFFAPDGGSVAYWVRGTVDGASASRSSVGGRVMRVALSGGQPTPIAVMDRLTGATWDGDRIVVGADAGLVLLSASGVSKPDTLTAEGATLPHFLPGGKEIVFSQRSGWQAHQIHMEVLTLATRSRKRLVNNAADGRFVSSGHLVFGRTGTLMAVPFDTRRLEITASPVVVVADVMQALGGGGNTAALTGAIQAVVSPLGDLLYLAGGNTPDPSHGLYSLDRQGRATPLAAAGEHPFFALQLSPDETKIAASTVGLQNEMHVVDLRRGTTQSLADRGQQLWPLWSRDGLRILRQGTVRDSNSLVSSPADGSRPAEAFIREKVLEFYPAFWSLDGSELFGFPSNLFGTFSVFQAVTVATGALRRIPNLPPDLQDPTLSPDGKLLAYSATESGGSAEHPGRAGEIFVQPWPSLDRKWKVSTNGGMAPKWTRNGRELIYITRGADSAGLPITHVMAMAVDAGSEFSPQVPQELFVGSFVTRNPIRSYDVTSDGSRFFVVMGPKTTAPAGELRLVSNWVSELGRLTARKAAP